MARVAEPHTRRPFRLSSKDSGPTGPAPAIVSMMSFANSRSRAVRRPIHALVRVVRARIDAWRWGHASRGNATRTFVDGRWCSNAVRSAAASLRPPSCP